MDLHARQRFMKQQLTLLALGADTPLGAGGRGRGVLSAWCRAVLPGLPPSGQHCLSGLEEDFLKENQTKQEKASFM